MPEERIGSYQVHPVAALFPLLEGQEFEELCEDIEAFGQRLPIVVYEGTLLDGRNRLRACLRLKIEPIVEEYTPRLNEDPGLWIISANITRRNLDADQRASMWTQADELMRSLRKQAAERQKAAGEQGKEGGRGHKKTLPLNSGEGFPAERRDRHARETVGQLATAAGVSRHKAAQAIAVKKHAPELIDQVTRGQMKLKHAAKIARQRQPVTRPQAHRNRSAEEPMDLIRRVYREMKRRRREADFGNSTRLWNPDGISQLHLSKVLAWAEDELRSYIESHDATSV